MLLNLVKSALGKEGNEDDGSIKSRAIIVVDFYATLEMF